MPLDGTTFIETHPDILLADKAADGTMLFTRHPDVMKEVLARRGAANAGVARYSDRPSTTRGHALRFLRAFRMALMKKLLVNGR